MPSTTGSPVNNACIFLIVGAIDVPILYFSLYLEFKHIIAFLFLYTFYSTLCDEAPAPLSNNYVKTFLALINNADELMIQ